MVKSFEKECNNCSSMLRITESSQNEWVIYEVDSGLIHCCGADNKKTDSSNRSLTVKTQCWFCNDIVFFHRSENGGMVLFDRLEAPWDVHPCWKLNSKYKNIYINKLYATLLNNNLSIKNGDYDLISKNILINKPSTRVYLESTDYRILDISVKNIVDTLIDFGINDLNAIPLPVKFKLVQEHKVRIFRRSIIINSFFSDAVEKQQKVIRAMQNMDIPNSVEIIIKSDNC